MVSFVTDLPLDLLTAEDFPRTFGRYELQRILGEGGMARVFGAELRGPAGFRKQVALKVIKAKYPVDQAREQDYRYLGVEAALQYLDA